MSSVSGSSSSRSSSSSSSRSSSISRSTSTSRTTSTRSTSAKSTSGALKTGSRGAAVSKLQDTLRSAGFNPGKTDGIFGPKTEAALKSYQASRGLKVDGIAGPRTFQAMDSFQPAKTGVGSKPVPGDVFSPAKTAPIGDLPKTGKAFIDKVAADAIKSQRQTGVPASVTLAQAILESNWGRSGLSTKANNFFGIKGQGPAGSVTMRTREVFNGKSTYINAPFRKYDSPAQSFIDHGRFLTDNKRYRDAFKHTDDPHRFAQEIAKAGYATDPKYAQSLGSIIDRYGLERFDAIARGQ